MRKSASLLDWVKDDIARLQKELGPSDRGKVNQYLDTVREVERRIQKAEAATADSPLPDLDRPVGVPAAYADHARLMFDLQVLALQGDVTRVITFQLARETSNRTYPEIGVPEPHHPLTHNGGDPEKLAKVAKINAFHVSLFAYFLQKLRATPDGDGTLLDHSLYLYGSGMGNRDMHDHTNLPILVAGGGAGKLKGGRHIRYDKPTPLANLHLTLLDRVGVRLDSFADSNGKVKELLEPLIAVITPMRCENGPRCCWYCAAVLAAASPEHARRRAAKKMDRAARARADRRSMRDVNAPRGGRHDGAALGGRGRTIWKPRSF